MFLSLAFVALIYTCSAQLPTPESCTTKPIHAWYDGDSFDGSIWTDKSGNVDPSTVTSGTKYTGPITGVGSIAELDLNARPVVYGGTSSTVVFNTNIPYQHTVFNLCKYRDTGSKRRIITGTNCNCLFGHHEGIAGRAYEEGWMFSSPSLEPNTQWVLTSQSREQTRANGVPRGVAGTGTLPVGKIGINDPSLAIGQEFSDWACAEVLVFNEVLETAEIECIEKYFSCKYDISLAGQPACDACEGVDCENDACQTGECNELKGECEYVQTDCDDRDDCTTDSCDPQSGCVHEPIECTNGNACDGEEYCAAGKCINGTNLECEPGFLCEFNDESNGCVRDCGLFAIDGYLRDCSEVMKENEKVLSDLDTSLSERIDAHESRLNEKDNEIAALQIEIDSVYKIFGEHETIADGPKEDVYSQLEELTERVNLFKPLAKYGETKGQSVIGVPASPDFENKYVIVFLLISNAVLLVVLIMVLCYYNSKAQKRNKYEEVKFYSSGANEENEQLKL